MSKHLHSKRGFWEGIPLDLLKPGINCENPLISPNGEFLSFTLNIKGENLFFGKIQNNCAITD